MNLSYSCFSFHKIYTIFNLYLFQEKLQSLLEQVLEGLKVTIDDTEESFQPRKSFLFSLSRPNSPPEKEISGIITGTLPLSDSNQTVADLNVTIDGSANGKESDDS